MMSTKNKWLAVSALAIVLPISLLTTFKLTGIISAPIHPETITLEPMIWCMERPACYVAINKKIEKSHIAEGLSAVSGVLICSYHENSPDFIFGYRDGVVLRVCVNATVAQGSLISITNHVQPTRENCTAVLYIGDSEWPEKHNIDVTNKRYYGVKDEEAYAKARVTGSPCYWDMPTYLVFDDENTASHGVNITNEILCRTNSEYKNVVTTFIFEVVVDAGDDFDSPDVREIGFGSYFASVYHLDDPVDFYKVQLEEGESVVIDLTPAPLLDLDLYLYDSNAMLVASSCSRGYVSEQLEFTASKSGFSFIKVARYHGSSGTYTLDISQKS